MTVAGNPQSSFEVVARGDGALEFRVSGVIDFDSVPDMLRESVARFGEQGDIVLDLSGVTRANSAGLALLIEWQRLARRPGRTLTIRNAPASLRNLARVSELESVLSL